MYNTLTRDVAGRLEINNTCCIDYGCVSYRGEAEPQKGRNTDGTYMLMP